MQIYTLFFIFLLFFLFKLMSLVRYNSYMSQQRVLLRNYETRLGNGQNSFDCATVSAESVLTLGIEKLNHLDRRRVYRIFLVESGGGV